MKHFLLIFPHLRTKDQFGGQRSRHIVDALAKVGVQTTVIVPLKDSMTGERRTGNECAVFSSTHASLGSRVLYANSLNNNRNSFLSRSLYVLSVSLSVLIKALMVRGYEVVVSVSLPPTFMLVGYIVSKLRRVPHVIEVRDIGVTVAAEIGVIKRGLFYKFALAFENYLYRKADMLIVVSNGFKSRLMERGVAEEKIDVIELGYDGNEDVADAGEINWLLPDDKFVVLYSGTLGHVFNIPLLLACAERLKENANIQFVLLGGGQNLEKFRMQAEAAGSHVKFLGNRPKREVAYYCRAANVCIYPARDGINVNSMLGNKIYDYMGSGTATIYSGQGGDVADMLQKSGGGLVCHGDADSLVAAVNKLFNDRSLSERLGKSAKDFIFSGYLAQDLANRYARAIDGYVCSRAN